MESGRRAQALAATGRSGDGGVAAPMASTSVISTYNPAQIRAAYGLPALPAAGAKLSAAQAAQLGAGQTTYIVDAMHDPNVAAELAAFNLKFRLPGCTTKAIVTNATLPLATASTSAGCELAVVYSNANAGMTSAALAYNAGWATEITLDVQWAHATAPLARIVLIEAPDASVNSLSAAVKLANAMGPGVVSMSFGANEGNWTASTDSAFAGRNMTYLAATGDSGAAVSWPAVSPNVLAVGGTRLSYSGSGVRSEQGWARTGGGISQYTAAPSYQANTVPGMGSLARRAVADVAFNADPTTGQYVAVMPPGSTAVSWLSVGGTSLSTPQWAGLIAVANAQRVLAAKAMIGVPHALLYGGIASVPGSYASAFADITQGSNGSCSTCTAKTGYDPLTGLGTPNVTNLLAALTAASSSNATTPVAGTPPVPAKTGPVITAAAMTGVLGKAMTGSINLTNSDNLAMKVTISGVPSGMTFTLSGSTLTARWANPATGNYSLSMRALDSAGRSTTAHGAGERQRKLSPSASAAKFEPASSPGRLRAPGPAISAASSPRRARPSRCFAAPSGAGPSRSPRAGAHSARPPNGGGHLTSPNSRRSTTPRRTAAPGSPRRTGPAAAHWPARYRRHNRRVRRNPAAGRRAHRHSPPGRANRAAAPSHRPTAPKR